MILNPRPNRRLIVSLVDDEGEYDFDVGQGKYRTTDGDTLVLPRRAVEALNMLRPTAGEKLEILMSWSGRMQDRPQWSIRKAGSPLTNEDRPAAPPEAREKPINGPRLVKRHIDPGPGLFDQDPRGTGTTGPAPRPASRAYPVGADQAFKEISAWVAAGLRENGMQWGDAEQQAIVCTVMIAEYKAGRIGGWRR